MQMTGEQRIAAPKPAVWQALNDPEVLRQCIPGCQSLERDGEHGFLAVAEVKIGPIGARFKGNVQLSDLDPPNGYTITGSGNGGIAGSAKGGAKVRLVDDAAGGTIVAYEVEAEVGGRMAQLGGPIIDATAKNLAGKFFAKFGEVVGHANAAPAPVAAPTADRGPAPAPALAETPSLAPGLVAHPAPAPLPAPSPAPASPTLAGAVSLWGWVAALVVAILAGFTLGANDVRGSVVMVVMVLAVVIAAAAYEAGRRGGRT